MWKKVQSLLLPVYFTAWFSYFSYFWWGLFRLDGFGNLWARHVNVWGDWAAHFTMGSAIAYRSWWPTTSPFLLNARFSYPFVTNFISGVLIRLGLPFFSGFVIPSWLCSCLLVVALYYFYRTFFASKKIAIVASLIFLLNGGLGFLWFFADVAASPTPLSTLLQPPQEYTRIDTAGIKWLSVIDSMVIPQRAFALGFPLTVIALTLVYRTLVKLRPATSTFNLTKNDWLRLLVAGLLLGLMPLIHTHSFLAAVIILSCWGIAALLFTSPGNHHRQWSVLGQVTRLPGWLDIHSWANLKRWQPWVVLGVITATIATPLYVFFFSQQVAGFISWHPGWLATEYGLTWLVFWLRNWAVTPLLAVLGAFTWLQNQTHKPRQMLLITPFLLLFILPNLFLFQPFAWDNTKLLIWASLGFSGWVGYLFVQKSKTGWGKLLISGLFTLTILSGTIDAYRIIRFDLHSYIMYTQEELELAEWVKTQTDAHAIWLTGTQHNHWLFNLTGRQAVMTYPGWLWTHGYPYLPIEAEVRHAYQQPSTSTVFSKYDIEYAVVGPYELAELGADEAGFRSRFPVVKETSRYRIFAVSK